MQELPARNSEEKTKDGVVGLFKKRWPFEMACSSKAGLSTSSSGYFVRTENIQALPKKQFGVVGLKKDGALIWRRV